MNTPKSYVPLVVWPAEHPETLHAGMTYTFQHGFFDPITNLRFEDVGLSVGGWYYQAMPLWPGATVFHRKRGAKYTVTCVFQENGRSMGQYKDGDSVDLSEVTELSICSETPFAMVQRSTSGHSPEWAVYQNEEGMAFVRPLSEFTEDRFKILYNGA